MFSWRYIKDQFDNSWNHWIPKSCMDEAHNPPNMMVITRPFTHTCPSCGYTITLYPKEVHLNASNS